MNIKSLRAMLFTYLYWLWARGGGAHMSVDRCCCSFSFCIYRWPCRAMLVSKGPARTTSDTNHKDPRLIGRAGGAGAAGKLGAIDAA